MRKRTLQHLFATGTGALLGGLVVFFVLVKLGGSRALPPDGAPATARATALGETSSETDSPSPSPPALPEVSARPSASPAAAGSALETRAEAVGVSFVLPAKYRVAAGLNVYEASTQGFKRFTVTTAPEDAEEEYIRLVKDLAGSAATGAPAFAPGATIVFQQVSNSAEERSDASYAKAQESVTTTSGLTGTRYRRVEGIQTYDIAYLTLPHGSRVAVHMTYSTEEPRFDEMAFAAALSSLRAL